MSTTAFAFSFQRWFGAFVMGLLLVLPSASDGETPPRAWRSPEGAAVAPIRTTPPKPATHVAAQPTHRQTAASSSGGKSISKLPSEHGQIWREYDISPYTSRVTENGAPPQQAIIDWILRDTGYASWHSDVVAVLSGTPQSLRVYHTPAMQDAVSHIVDRYVSSASKTYMYGLHIYTLAHPDWRTRAQRLLRSVPVQSEGVEAWLVAREDAMLLREELARRSDFQNHGSSKLLVPNGQNTIVNFNREHPYVKSHLSPESTPGSRDANVAELTEGLVVEVNPLMSLDGTTVDAMIKCQVDQVERLVPVKLQSPPGRNNGRPWYNIDVPQRVSCEFHERFRWPRNKVLLVSLGVIPRAVPHFSLTKTVKLPMPKSPPRGDLLLFVEHKGDAVDADTADGSGPGKTQDFRGRY